MSSQETKKAIIRQSILAYIIHSISNVLLFLGWGTLTYLGWVRIFYGDLQFHVIEGIILGIYIFGVMFFWWYFRYFTYLLITSHRIEKNSPTIYLWAKKEILWYHEIIKIWFFYPSFIAKLLHYWTIEITSWDEEKNNIRFKNAPEPDKIVKKLRKIKTDYHKKWYDK